VVVAIELQSTIGFVTTVAPFVTRMNPFVTQGAGSISAKYPKTRPWSSKVQVPTMFVIKPKIEVKLVELLDEVDELELMISLVLRPTSVLGPRLSAADGTLGGAGFLGTSTSVAVKVKLLEKVR
jgi:hypothetical protein